MNQERATRARLLAEAEYEVRQWTILARIIGAAVVALPVLFLVGILRRVRLSLPRNPPINSLLPPHGSSHRVR